MEKPEKWGDCLNVLKQEQTESSSPINAPAPTKEKETWCWTRRNVKTACSGEAGEKRPKRKL